MYEAKILADSISLHGVRLTTMQATFPRFALAELNTHCMLSRNSASSRAIPVEKRIAAIQDDPFVPAAFSKNKRGMQASEEIEDQIAARDAWLRACARCCEEAGVLAAFGVHKQHANRLLEPFAWHTVIVTATDWRNFFALRCSPMAQPEIRIVAEMMRESMASSEPVSLCDNQWHLPLVRDVDGPELGDLYRNDTIPLVSAARCARVSYLTHEGIRSVDADLELAKRLLHEGHMSPFEHVARPATYEDAVADLEREGVILKEGTVDLRKYHFGKLRGWVPYRWTIPNEAVFGGGEP